MQKLSKVKLGKLVNHYDSVDWKAQKSCGKDSKLGRWFCVTHKESFRNQFDKDTHIHDGTHELAWWCPSCVQYEQP